MSFNLNNYRVDESLTDRQSTLKWILYCELESETYEDIEATLQSLLRDVQEAKKNE